MYQKTKISKKQRVEIDFLKKSDICFGKDITPEIEKEYIKNTVYGIKVSDNILLQAKRRFDITVAMWKEDTRTGLLFFSELENDEELFIRNIGKQLRMEYEKKIG